MRDLPEAMRLHRLHQRRKHIPAVTRGLLQVAQAMTAMRFRPHHFIGIPCV
jgi:hypothetical protein